MLAALAETLRGARSLAHKADIAPVLNLLRPAAQGEIRLGDDCAAIPDGEGFLLLAIEGFLPAFVGAEPRFAGWSGVMVNLSDIAAMGGRAIAVVDAVWSESVAAGAPMLEGLNAAAVAYGVPLVGGHSNMRAGQAGLAVAVLGRARALLTSFDARPGDRLIAAIDLRGRMRDPHPFWDASSEAPAARLRGDLEILPAIAEAGLCQAAKDISNAGLVGTAAMLMECSGVGGVIDLQAVPRPDGLALESWLLCFPSFGFLLAVPQGNAEAVMARFAARGIAAAAIGTCDDTRVLAVAAGDACEVIWRFADAKLLGAVQ
jgi:AIR synthase-related protein